ncbi:DUF6517 family protein [Natrinema versiforme]|uniref:Lipoprotein n=1 Tax=Natrinema versiforme JCM 10478 TaxID=1227496 RepID=L9XS35_9EURY|nr:DUF6517 family protein [Natrinema versiforme]ELY64560.1 hypothetical protein C489_17444 [Natrinema versiforme JCM 10478]
MTTSRRSLLAAGATGTIALTAGCLDFVLGNGPLEFDSDRVAPTDGALEETGYDEKEVTEETIDRTVELPAGIERDVEASIWTSVYSKQLEYRGQEREGSAFAAVSIPGMEVAGRSVNPLDDMSNEELLAEFLNQIDGERGEIRNIQHEESFELSILDGARETDVFIGESELAGEPIDIEIKITSFDHEDDLLVLLGTLPKMNTKESANVEVLMESVEHPVDS